MCAAVFPCPRKNEKQNKNKKKAIKQKPVRGSKSIVSPIRNNLQCDLIKLVTDKLVMAGRCCGEGFVLVPSFCFRGEVI